ncbi:MAG: recombinase family protein [Clostridia bacterium]|nr:recombinase family protein [Clostridia bacterium]
MFCEGNIAGDDGNTVRVKGNIVDAGDNTIRVGVTHEQFTSYEAQVDYYTQFIHSHPDWVFVKVYTDEGISAVSTKHRDGFNEMVEEESDVGSITLPANPVCGAHVASQRCTILRYG